MSDAVAATAVVLVPPPSMTRLLPEPPNVSEPVDETVKRGIDACAVIRVMVLVLPDGAVSVMLPLTVIVDMSAVAVVKSEAITKERAELAATLSIAVLSAENEAIDVLLVPLESRFVPVMVSGIAKVNVALLKAAVMVISVSAAVIAV